MKKIVGFIYILIFANSLFAENCFLFKVKINFHDAYIHYNLLDHGIHAPEIVLHARVTFMKGSVVLATEALSCSKFDYSGIDDNPNYGNRIWLQHVFNSNDVNPKDLKLKIEFGGFENDNSYLGDCNMGFGDDDYRNAEQIESFISKTPRVTNNIYGEFQYLEDCSAYQDMYNINGTIQNIGEPDLIYRSNYTISYECYTPPAPSLINASDQQILYNNPITEVCNNYTFKIKENPHRMDEFYNYSLQGSSYNIKLFDNLLKIFQASPVRINFFDLVLIGLVNVKINNDNLNTMALSFDLYNNYTLNYNFNYVGNLSSTEKYTLYDIQYKYPIYCGNPPHSTWDIANGVYHQKVKVYPPITAANPIIDQPCTDNTDGANKKGSVKVESVVGGKPDYYSYEITEAHIFKNTVPESKITEFGQTMYNQHNFVNNTAAPGDASLMQITLMYGINVNVNTELIHYTNYIRASSSNIFNNLPYGYYKIKVKSTLRYSDCYFEKWVIIYPVPNPIITLDNEAVICQPSGVFEFNATSNIGITSWVWNSFPALPDPLFTSPQLYLPRNTNPSNTQPVASGLPSINSYNKVELNNSNLGGCFNIHVTDVNKCTADKKIDVPNFTPPAYSRKTIDHVLNISSSRLEGIWLNDFRDISITNTNPQEAYNILINKNPYESSQAGLFKGLSAYNYLGTRQQKAAYNTGADDNLSEDGIIEDPTKTGTTVVNGTSVSNKLLVPLFNWSNPRFEKEEQKWIKEGEITKYSSNTEEIENKDILGNYSAAIYGYNSTLPVAVAANAKNTEIAFEGFEEYPNQTNAPNALLINEVNNTSGNFDIINKLIAINLKKYDKYKITNASGRYAVTDIDKLNPPYTDEQFALLKLKVIAKAPTTNSGLPYEENLVSTKGKLITNTCNIPGSDFYGTMVQFEDGIPGFSTEEQNCNRYWTGDLYIEKDEEISEEPAYDKIEFTNVQAHTGNMSVKIKSGSTNLKQFSLDLQTGHDYLISGWIKSDQTYSLPPKALDTYNGDNNIGITINGIDDNGSAISSTGNDGCNSLIKPTGPVIDGWQKFEAKFTYPSGSKKLLLSFNNNQVFYLDDIRLCPYNGNIQTYVYDPVTLRQEAILDQNNFATIYKYDEEGKLFQIKKETVEGIKTIQVTQSFMQPNKE